ncbi:MAG: hypothetical protein KDD41_12705 [Flavobacteriales bacterium]|nr:hypothetical protein [Flavobacteriales bacterium]
MIRVSEMVFDQLFDCPKKISSGEKVVVVFSMFFVLVSVGVFLIEN